MKIRKLVPGTSEPAHERGLADALEPERYIALRPVWVIGPLVAYRVLCRKGHTDEIRIRGDRALSRLVVRRLPAAARVVLDDPWWSR